MNLSLPLLGALELF